MDFAWVVGALRRGLRVTRKSWPGQRPQYIRITREPGQETIAFVGPDGQARRWMCSSIDVLATDWEEYVEPKKKPVFGNTKLSFDENGQPHMGDTMTVEELKKVHSGKFVEDSTDFATEDLAAEDWQAHLLGLLADSLANQISQRVVQLLQAAKGPDPNRKPGA